MATISPCILPLYPGYLAYLSGSQQNSGSSTYGRYFLGFFVLAGVLTMMLALGLLIGVAFYDFWVNWESISLYLA